MQVWKSNNQLISTFVDCPRNQNTLASPLKRMIFNSSATSATILVAGSFNFIIRFLATTSKASPGVKRPTFTPFYNQKIRPK